MKKGKKAQIKELLLKQRELEEYFKSCGYIDVDDALCTNKSFEGAYTLWYAIDDELALYFNPRTVAQVRRSL